ncbi:hypothetical protein LshimejAT787_0902490 [Lyophyllum shimeji]|uniref:Mediator of RNA polymerase II transcription subunit 8 n=1 Tax=Lyophyllum shimeji TaxID=47721 RepID=A0A9P3UMZ4_LYOSH|nr:hypothetical protein LshimejAT787_0902490 [Lyophyllum shimeji]
MSSFHNPPTVAPAGPVSAPLTTSGLPVSQLESLRFKASQIIDSIQSLQRTLEAGHTASMPSWPDILSKYNILLSQTHSFSMGLSSTLSGAASTTAQGQRAGGTAPPNVLERVVLHPSTPMSDAQLDGEVIPLLRNQQTTDVLRVENETVRRVAEHMATKGSLGVLGAPSSQPQQQRQGGQQFALGMGAAAKKPVDYTDVLRECEEIREAHDRRVERAVRAVTMLRERFEWRARVEVEVEEPEELEWDPRAIAPVLDADESGEGEENGMDESAGEGEGEGEGDVVMEEEEGGSNDEDEVEALVDSAMDTQSPASPAVTMIGPSAGLVPETGNTLPAESVPRA